jgi:transposase InsO family protein
MSSSALSIAQTASVTPPAPRGVGYIDLDTAAKRWGIDRQSFIRRQLPRFMAAGFVKGIVPPGARAAQWHVREDADARLARIKPAENQPEELELNRLSDKQRRHTLAKVAIVRAFIEFRNSPAAVGMSAREVIEHFLTLLSMGRLDVKLPPDMKAPKPRTLEKRVAQLKSPDGVAALIDGRGDRQQKPPPSDPFFTFVKDLYLDLRERSVAWCHDIACREAERAGWTAWSIDQTRRFVTAIPKSVRDMYRKGSKAFNDIAARHIVRDYSGLRSNEILCGDHHNFDVMVKWRGGHVRPWLTCWQDVRSRRIVGWTITAGSGNTDTILEALAKACRVNGVPESVYVDNGRDYDSAALQGITKRQRRQRLDLDETAMAGVFGGLGISVTHCWPYHGQSKPVERFFKTLEDRFGRWQSTYCGGSPAHKPEDLAAKLERGAAPTLEEFADAFAVWLEGDYHARGHSGDGMDGRTPVEVFDACLEKKRTLPDELLAVMLWKPSRAIKVGRNGARWGGVVYGGDWPALWEWKGKEIIVRVDPSDIDRAALCDTSGKFLYLARANEKLPFKATPEEAKAAIAAIKRDRKRVREYHQQRPRIHRDIPGEIYRQRAEERQRQREQNPPAAPSIQPVMTPMNDQLPLLRRALDWDAQQQQGHRLAAGAEGMRLDLLSNPPELPEREPSTFEEMMRVGEILRKEEEDAAALECEPTLAEVAAQLNRLQEEREAEESRTAEQRAETHRLFLQRFSGERTADDDK